MPKEKLLFVITKLELGGAQKHVLDVLRSLDRERFELFLYTAREGLLVEEALSLEGVTVRRSRFLERPINPLKDLLALIELSRYIGANRFDIVHTHSSKAGILGRLAARVAGVRTVVHTVHGWSFNDLQPAFVRMLYRRLERLCANFTSTIVVVSENDRDRGLKAGIGRQEQYALIRYGINAVRYSETDGNARKEWGIADGRYCIGNISCLKPQKAPLDYIEYCVRVKRKLPGCKFVLVGDGELRPKVEKMISARGMERDIILTGWRRDIPGLLASFDMLVLTSLWEGLPIAVLESIAAGKPVAATDTGGIREVIDDGRTGLLVSPRDMDSLAEKTVRLLQDRDKMSSIARAARAKLGEEYSLEGMAARLSRVYTLSTPYEKHGPRV